MITLKPLALLAILISVVHEGTSATRYVDGNGSNPIPPYTDWSSAAVTIQDAIDAAVDGDLVLVTNGVYNTGGRTVYGALTNRIVVDKAIMVQSLNGPFFTSIEGNLPLGDTAVRCAYLTNGATLSGFTLINGATLKSFQGQSDANRALYASGAGAWCESTSAVLTNCVLTGNEAEYGYGGMGGGAYSGTLLGCVLTGNRAVKGGGAFGSVLNDCVVSNNLAFATVLLNAGSAVSTYGGGVQNCQLTNCSVLRNGSDSYGGGAGASTLVDCAVEENSAYRDGGGIYLGTLIRCRLARNSARNSAGGAYSATLDHCVLSDNSSAYGGGASLGVVKHCEFSGNLALVGGGATYQATVTASALVNNSAVTNGGALPAAR